MSTTARPPSAATPAVPRSAAGWRGTTSSSRWPCATERASFSAARAIASAWSSSDRAPAASGSGQDRFAVADQPAHAGTDPLVELTPERQALPGHLRGGQRQPGLAQIGDQVGQAGNRVQRDADERRVAHREIERLADRRPDRQGGGELRDHDQTEAGPGQPGRPDQQQQRGGQKTRVAVPGVGEPDHADAGQQRLDRDRPPPGRRAAAVHRADAVAQVQDDQRDEQGQRHQPMGDRLGAVDDADQPAEAEPDGERRGGEPGQP